MGEATLIEERQKEDKAAWDAYWKLRDLDSRGSFYPRMRYYVHKAFDTPATWFRGSLLPSKTPYPLFRDGCSTSPEQESSALLPAQGRSRARN